IHRKEEIAVVAMQVGFKDASSFTRTFKKYYDLSPTEFRKENPNRFSKIRQLHRKNGQPYPSVEKYLCLIDESKKWIRMNAKIEVLEAPELKVAGVTHIGMNGVEVAFEKIIRWANGKGLMRDPEAKLGRVFYDSAKVTPPEKVRMSVFIKPVQPFETEEEVNAISIPTSRCIVGRFEITPQEFEKSWTGLFIWMNEQGYKKGPGNPYEIYHNDFREHPENKFEVDLYIPIE
ncbi:MAG: GyrI-like domain-containing protein, partial [Bacteroidota bacterium]